MKTMLIRTDECIQIKSLKDAERLDKCLSEKYIHYTLVYICNSIELVGLRKKGEFEQL